MHLLIFFRRAETVDGRDRRDDNDILTRQQGLRRGMAQAVYLGVYHRFLLNIGI